MKAVSLATVLISVLAAGAAGANAAEQQLDQAAVIEKAVKACVEVVHATKARDFDQMFYKEFDAYYNPASGTVQNNAYRAGDTRPLYTFNKCMVQKGVPLK